MEDDVLKKLFDEVTAIKEAVADSLKPKEWMSLEEASEYLGISVRQLYRLVAMKQVPYKYIPGTKKIRFKKRHLDIWLETGKNVNTDIIPAKIIKEINKLDLL